MLRCHLFFFINSCAFSFCLSFLLPDETSGRNVVNSSVCFSTVCCSLNYYTSISFVLHKCRNFFSVRTSVQTFSSFLRASVLPRAAATLPSVQPPTFVRFVPFLFWLFSLLYFSHFAFTYFSYFALTFFSSITNVLYHTAFHFSFLMKPLGETWLILLSVVLPSFAL